MWWMEGGGEGEVGGGEERARGFGGRAVIVKDYVKSQKHAWGEACFIPRADDVEGALRVVRRFLGLQGADVGESGGGDGAEVCRGARRGRGAGVGVLVALVWVGVV